MSYRKEIKFRLNIGEAKLLKFSLLEKGMEMLFPKRIIHSCYFDTKSLDMFHESDEGSLPRKKIRLRWYDNNCYFKEIKSSSLEGRFKTTKKLHLNKRFDFKKTKFYDMDYGYIYPILIVSYIREYFIYENLRLTFDSQISYENCRCLFKKKSLDTENVMEVKTSINTSDDFIEEKIKIQPTRFSKYSRGISILNLSK
tara:strand:+ start:41 stop:634 length:594 start_codon:yes stop_codon:yes gene_type:complete